MTLTFFGVFKIEGTPAQLAEFATRMVIKLKESVDAQESNAIKNEFDEMLNEIHRKEKNGHE